MDRFLTEPRHRLLLVGYGYRGKEWHQVVGRQPRADVAAIVDPDPAARDHAAAAGIPSYPSIADAVRDVEADGAIIASPPACHADDACACLEAGLGVLVEKPLALRTEDARRVAVVAEQTRSPALVVQNFRYRPRARAIASVLASIGRPRSVVISSARTTMRPDPLRDLSIHHLDALRKHFGMPEDVWCEIGPHGLAFLLTWSGGLRATYHHTEIAHSYHYVEEIVGDLGKLIVDGEIVRLRRSTRRARRVKIPRTMEPETVILDRFLDSLSGGSAEDLSAAENIATIVLVVAAEESATTGRAVPVPQLVG